MAIAVEMDFSGATLEQYDQVVEKMVSVRATPARRVRSLTG